MATTLIVTFIIFYIIIMIAVLSGRGDAFDNVLMRKIHFESNGHYKAQTPKIRRLMMDASAMGGDTLLVIISLFMIGVSSLLGNWDLFLSFAIATCSARFLGLILKKLANRTRPDFIPDSPQMFTSSFPSVHSMMAIVLYGWFSFIMPTIIGVDTDIMLQIICISLILIIAYSRLYLGVHWPLDVIAGLISGLVILLATWLIMIM